eukprot:463824_1
MGHCFRIIATFSLSMTASSNVVTAKYQVDEHTIFGYIRRMEERHYSNIRACIPMDVTQISKGTHEWRFRIVSGNKIGTSHYTTLIGIQDINGPPVLHKPFIQKGNIGYALMGGTYPTNKADVLIHRFFRQLLNDPNEDSEYGEEFCQTGDTMKMCLDMNSQQLSYTINNTSYGSPFEIDATKQYKLGVSLEPDVEIEML